MTRRIACIALAAAVLAAGFSPSLAYQQTTPQTGLWERISPTDGEASNKIPVHRLSAALGEWAVGNLTRQQVIDGLSLGATEQAEIDAIAAAYNAKASAAEKVGYLWQIERCFILVETGNYNKAKAKAVLGF